MKTTRRAFIKEINWVLAGIIGMLGFAGCNKSEPLNEYGTPHADYTVKGTVVNKVTKKPIEGIRVGYSSRDIPNLMYGVPQVPYTPKAHVLTNTKGEFKLTDRFFPEGNKTLPVSVEDIDGEKNGSFQSEYLEVDFSKAEHSGKTKSWYQGEYTVNMNIELTEIEKE
jgi:putative lipoprotein (rSAM/lipoprotein system)